jgi:O-antigen/teichoic acid export membrane protein
LLALGGGVFATLLALGLWLGGYSAIYYGSALCVAAWLATDPLYNHLECVFRGTRHFGALGIALTFQNCFGLLVSFLPAFFGAGGMILGRALQGPARILMRIWKTPLRAVNRGRFEDIRELCRSGVPILMAGTLYSFLAVADRSLATVLLTPRDVGNLALSGLVIAAIQLVPTSVGNLLYPRIGADYGRTGSTRSLRRFVWIGLGIGGITLVPGCLLAYFFVEPVTLKFLPKYSDGIAAAKINSLGSLAFISFSLSGIIAVVRRMRLYIGAIIASLLIAWLSGAVLIRAGYGIEAAAYARAISTGLLAVFTVGYAYALTNGKVDGTTPKDDPA